MPRSAVTSGIFASLLLASAASSPRADDDNVQRYAWGGLYVGAHLGGALQLTTVDDPFGNPIYGDTVRSPGPVAGGQLGYNWQLGQRLVGLEADASWADLLGTNTCFAYSGYYISANCHADTSALGTFAARLGWIVGGDAGTLLYGKIGAAWRYGKIEAATNDNPGYPFSEADGVRWGWMLGAGAERAISPRWSLNAEYDYLHFGNQGFATPPSGFQPVPSGDPNALTPVASRGTDVSMDTHLFKVGLNYRLQDTAASAGSAPPPPAQPIAGTTLEIGARYVHGWGRFQKDLGIQGEGVSSLASRLTYSRLRTNGAELFARADVSGGLMVKGFVGKGDGNGHLNDEDWGLPFADFIPYSNTWSEAGDRIRYGVIDIGYDVWRDARFRLAPFAGYSVLHQYMTGSGCVQLANPNSDCTRPIPTTVEAISEDDVWQAMRLGIAADLRLVPGLTLLTDAAYLPYVHFSGTDDHVLRDLVSPERGNGTGTQLELILRYAATDQLTLGVGGRYWAMWTRDGIVNFGGEMPVPMRFSVEQAALLVQGSYAFSDADN